MTSYPDVPAGQPLVLFFHGNSFPAGTYNMMLNDLRRRGMQVQALEKIGHNPAYPVTSNWPHLVEEIHAFAKPLIAAHSGPVVPDAGRAISATRTCRGHGRRASAWRSAGQGIASV